MCIWCLCIYIQWPFQHYNDVIMSMIASQITSLTFVYSTVYSGADQMKTSKLRVTGLCVGNSPGTGKFPALMANNAENVSIWWRHHEYKDFDLPVERLPCWRQDGLATVLSLTIWIPHLKRRSLFCERALVYLYLIHRCNRLLAQPFIQADQRKHQSAASLAFVRGIHRISRTKGQ